MLPLGLDPTLRPVVELVTFVPSSDESPNPGGETFDSHLARQDESAAPEPLPIGKAASKENEDEPECDENGSQVMTPPTAPIPSASQETSEDLPDGHDANESETEISIANINAELSSQGNERQVELNTKTTNVTTSESTLEQPVAFIGVDVSPSAADEFVLPDIAETTNDVPTITTVDVDATDAIEKPKEIRDSSETVAERVLVLVNEPSLEEVPASISDVVPMADSSSEPLKRETRKTKENQIELPLATVKPTDTSAAVNVTIPSSNDLPLDHQPIVSTDREARTNVDVTVASPDRDTSQTPNSATNRLVQHLAGASDERKAGANPLSGTDQNRFLDRVARAFKAAESRQGIVKLRLHPPELGSLRIELRVQNGVLSARLEAETAVTQSLLIEHAYALRDRLSEQGIRVERFDVELADRRSMDHPHGFDERSNREREPTGQTRRQQTLAANQETTSVRPNASLSVPGKINVII